MDMIAALGQINLIEALKVENFTQVHFQLLTDFGPTLTVDWIMGIITGHDQQVTAVVGTFPVGTAGFHDNEIHTLNVIGPELKVRILGPPDTEVSIVGWIFLH